MLPGARGGRGSCKGRLMKLHIEWNRPVSLKDGAKQNLIYFVDPSKLSTASGIYILGRRWGSDLEALYVGKANNIRSRVKGQFNNLRLMQHLRNAKTGKRILLTGRIVTRPGQRLEKSLLLLERALIRYFLSEGHDLVNKQGARLRRHEVTSSGKHPRRFFPSPIFLERAKGE
jgi:hypothetical protein